MYIPVGEWIRISRRVDPPSIPRRTPPAQVTPPCTARGAPGSRSVVSSPPRCRTSRTARCSSSSSSSDNGTTLGGSGGVVTPGPGETTPPSSPASAVGPGGGNPLVAGSRRTEVGGGGAEGARSFLLGRSRPAMALGQAAREQQEGGAVGVAVTATNAVLATANRTERGQRLRALNWVKQVCGARLKQSERVLPHEMLAVTTATRWRWWRW